MGAHHNSPGEAREHTLDVIEHSRVYFSSPTEFNDPFDCFPRLEIRGDWPEFLEGLPEGTPRLRGRGFQTGVAPLLPMRMLAQRVVEAATRTSIESVLEVAREERAPLTTPQPLVSRDRGSHPS